MITGVLLVMMGALWYVLHAERAAPAGTDVRELRADRGRRRRGAGGDARRRLRRRLDVPAAAAVLPGRAVAGLVGEPLLRRQPRWSARLLRLLPRRARADDDRLRRPDAGARLAVPARARAGGAAAAGDRRDRRRDRRPALDDGGIGDRARPARPHLRLGRRLRRARREEPRLLLRPLDRESRHLPCRGRHLRAPAALRRPSLRDDEGVRRRLGGVARLHRHRLLAPPLHGLRAAALGAGRSRESPRTPRCSRSP